MRFNNQMPTVEFSIGDTVFHKSEPDRQGIVCQITFYQGGHFFNIQWGPSNAANHYAFELAREKQYELSS